MRQGDLLTGRASSFLVSLATHSTSLPTYPPPRLPAFHLRPFLARRCLARSSRGRDFEARYSGTDGGQILSASKYTEGGKPAGSSSSDSNSRAIPWY